LSLVSKFIKKNFLSKKETRFIENKQSFLTRVLKIKNEKPESWVKKINKSRFTHTCKISVYYKTLASIIIKVLISDNLEKKNVYPTLQFRIKSKFHQDSRPHDEIFSFFQRQIIEYKFDCESNINRKNPFELILQAVFFILFYIFYEIFQIAESVINETLIPRSI
jgi:hypothetical protein